MRPRVAHHAGILARFVFEIGARDIDVPLSELEQDQAAALGRCFAAMAPDERPDVLLVSPYVQAQQTARAIVAQGGLAPEAKEPVADERLREKEFGILDRLTRLGSPQQAELRDAVGQLYDWPPGARAGAT